MPKQEPPDQSSVDEEGGTQADKPDQESHTEVGGPKGPEPTRYGDWEKNGRCIDF